VHRANAVIRGRIYASILVYVFESRLWISLERRIRVVRMTNEWIRPLMTWKMPSKENDGSCGVEVKLDDTSNQVIQEVKCKDAEPRVKNR
jgi:hypothetical protein